MVVCDPVKRVLSRYYHLFYDTNEVNLTTFEHQIEASLADLSRYMSKSVTIEERIQHLYNDFVNRRSYFCHRNQKENDRHNILLNGLYAVYIWHWYNIFDKNQILVINGQDLLENPASILKKVQSFVGVKEFLTEKDFVFHDDKGFYCLKANDRNGTQCLANTKVCQCK